VVDGIEMGCAGGVWGIGRSRKDGDGTLKRCKAVPAVRRTGRPRGDWNEDRAWQALEVAGAEATVAGAAGGEPVDKNDVRACMCSEKRGAAGVIVQVHTLGGKVCLRMRMHVLMGDCAANMASSGVSLSTISSSEAESDQRQGRPCYYSLLWSCILKHI
jgi:hypothetical protein